MTARKPFILGLQERVPDGPMLDTNTLFNRFGHNSGNMVFHYAIMNHVNDPMLVCDWWASSTKINEQGEIALLPAANQLGTHADFGNLAKKFEELNCRIVAIGLGAQAGINDEIPEVPQGTINWIKQIAGRAVGNGPNISVRGPFTQKVMEHYGFGPNVVALGCPSLFLNPDPALGQQIASNLGEIKRIAVPSGHQGWTHLSRIEASLARIVSVTGGSYIGQSPLAMIQLTRGEARLMAEADLRACRDFACPEMDLEEFIRWSERHGNLFLDVPSWMEHYRRFDFVIGARIHGVMLALQVGVPGVVIAHDSRTLELCQMMHVPYVLARDVASGITREQLPSLFKFDADAFDRNRRMLARRYVDFLEANELNPVGWLKDIAAAAH